MKLKIIDMKGGKTGELELPSQFAHPVRADLIKKAVLAIQNNNRQSYGAFERAGKGYAAIISKRRRDYKTCYGKGISRTPRKILSRRGAQFHWVGAFAPNTVGGRRAHPPKPEKVFDWKINDKERRKAVCSALSAVMIPEMVAKRGHIVPDNYPFIMSDDLESLSKTKDLVNVLKSVGFEKELERANVSGIRAGKGKLRGRRKVSKKSLLIVALNADRLSSLVKAALNIPGVDCVSANGLNAELLAPGGHPGRICLFTKKAVESLSVKPLVKVNPLSNNVNPKTKADKDKVKDSGSEKVSSSKPVKTEKKVKKALPSTSSPTGKTEVKK